MERFIYILIIIILAFSWMSITSNNKKLTQQENSESASYNTSKTRTLYAIDKVGAQ